MATDEGDHRSVIAMCQGDAGVGCDAERSRDTRDDLKRDSGISERLHLFPTPSKDERIAAFQSDYCSAFRRVVNQEFDYLLLRISVLCPLLSDVNGSGAGSVIQQGGIRQVII